METVQIEKEEMLEIDITDDMYCGALNPEIVNDYICSLCYGIVWEPIKCAKCEIMICKKCINPK